MRVRCAFRCPGLVRASALRDDGGGHAGVGGCSRGGGTGLPPPRRRFISPLAVPILRRDAEVKSVLETVRGRPWGDLREKGLPLVWSWAAWLDGHVCLSSAWTLWVSLMTLLACEEEDEGRVVIKVCVQGRGGLCGLSSCSFRPW